MVFFQPGMPSVLARGLFNELTPEITLTFKFGSTYSTHYLKWSVYIVEPLVRVGAEEYTLGL